MGFSLDPGRKDHCSVKISEDTLIINGGYHTWYNVTEYSGIGGEVTSRQLPDLLTGRNDHACGHYTTGEIQVMAAMGTHWSLTGKSQVTYSVSLHR